MIVRKYVINSQGTFKISWSSKQHWVPSGIVLMDSEGTIHWHMDYPFGILTTYPCGTKRFKRHDL